MKHLFTLLFLFISNSVYCQSETDNWFFGLYAGINFSTGTPISLTGSVMATTEGTAVISDAAGNLLFYSDGITVWNSMHLPMPNGTGLLGDVSATQSALIIKKPLSTNLYFLFTVDDTGGVDGFHYSIVDMNLQGGLGDVTAEKNIFIQNNVTEKLCAVTASNDTDVWVMVHDWGSDAFYAYLLTDTGFNFTPVITNAGSVHDASSIQNSVGYMKFSPDGNKLAAAIGYQDMAEVFDFDNQAGIVSDAITFNIGEHCYGIEFSSNSSKLYLTHYSNSTQNFYLDQFDLSAGTDSAIIASQDNIVVFFDPDNVRALQLAKTGKIYVAKSGTPFLGVINEPNLAGALCYYADNVINIDAGGFGNLCMLGFPNFVASYLRMPAPVSSFGVSDNSICIGNCIYFSDSSQNNPTQWQWIFTGANPDTSSLQNPGPICYNTSGNYDVTLITFNAAGSDTIISQTFINVFASSTPPVITQTDSLLHCSTGITFQWYLDSVAISGATNQDYIATQNGNYYVVITNDDGCKSSSTVLAYFPSVINELNFKGINIFPNPVENQLTILNKNLTVNTITIKDVLGRIVQSTNLNLLDDSIILDVQFLNEGVYFIELKTDKEIFTQKFVKR